MSRIVLAQTYPSRPVTIIVPFAAGGSTDTPARIIAERMRRTLDQLVIVENVAANPSATAAVVGRSQFR
jgi:tripartite-type tricarboxylate transporter receptor subunit TctC